MMRVLLVATTDWYLYNFRKSFAYCLRQKGFDVIFISPPGDYSRKLQQSGFRWVEWQVSRQTFTPWNEIPSIIKLIRIYLQENPVLVQHFNAKAVIYGSLAARFCNVPAVINNITGLGFLYVTHNRLMKFLQPIVNLLYSFTNKHSNCATIFENSYDRDLFLRRNWCTHEQTYLIKGAGVNPKYLTPSPEPIGIPIIVLPARMIWDKGIGVFVEASRILKEKKSIRFILVGKPDIGNPNFIDESIINRWVEDNLVEWWGWETDKKTIYENCHIVVLPTSYGEGVPTVLIEGAACGRPLIASDIPGCREIISHGINGLLIPPGNSKALADAISLLLDDANLRRKMGAAGRQMVLHNFTEKQVNTATFAIYNQLLNNTSYGSLKPNE